MIGRNTERFDVGGGIGHGLRMLQRFLGERIHGRVVAQTIDDINHLLGQHGRVLAGELREGSIRTTRTAGQVAGTADFVFFLAICGITLEFEGFCRLAIHLVPLITRRLDTCFLWSRLCHDGACGDKGGSNCQCHEFFHFYHLVSVRGYFCFASHSAMAFISSSLTRCITPFMAAD